MPYLPHTPEDIDEMLALTGHADLDTLFEQIPEPCRRVSEMNLPEALSEWQLDAVMENLAEQNALRPEYKIFLGAGSYDHYIPETVPYLTGRSEFATSYTPYQPELSQGTLQAMYEYQTLMTRLTGMDIANASLYDGASAFAEGLLMAVRVTKRKRIALSTLVHPFYRQAARTYLEPTGCDIIELPPLPSGTTDLSPLAGRETTAALALQSPNFFGCVENLPVAAELIQGSGGLLVATFTEPLAFALYRSPGEDGADIACGEGQSLGIPQSFGGPGLGIFAARSDYMRAMPGRLVGKTRDRAGREGFVLTLATREQHIRRERATSNICTNSSLCALACSIYIASLGGTGIRALAKMNYDKAQYLKQGLAGAGWKLPFPAATFNEFVVKIPGDATAVHRRLLEKKILAGLSLERWYPELPGHYLLCATETSSRSDMDLLIEEVRS
ncbi:MAG: aminomethyl-transferring glycine dehydrogenase subunit GcvPA [Syntrophales bacterium]|jgi:glycine dehydrogenase subunit 1|nr:aminomethyl-transferring glycine dehydrogenase subunit GcvPA [Syntrophales bacterium]MCK9527321.1 aminomethyl-transferring glycine dehydrogenase subunit GcvPA [Syntrophales bacterium]MDX9921209.1 aminomethyl-transferring glycine dehydrogenase subunit GcvPA [Syntrophales bacterium]